VHHGRTFYLFRVVKSGSEKSRNEAEGDDARFEDYGGPAFIHVVDR